LDSRGYVHLKLQNYQAAIADYDAAIRVVPRFAVALYGRGVAKVKSGNIEEGNADIAEALKLDGAIADRMAKLGVAP
jgi:tetratricopeptide (TPR) repeat protein